MFRKVVPVLLIALVLALAGCKKDSEVTGFIKDFDALTDDMVKTINASPTSAGIDEAQKKLDAKKADLKTRLNALKELRGFQVSKESLEGLTKSLTENSQKLAGLATKIGQSAVANKDIAMTTKYAALMKSYGEIK
jgi:hypothetical protein